MTDDRVRHHNVGELRTAGKIPKFPFEDSFSKQIIQYFNRFLLKVKIQNKLLDSDGCIFLRGCQFCQIIRLLFGHKIQFEKNSRKESGHHLMVRFSMTSGKFSSSAFSSSKVMEPLLSLSADSKSASVRSSSFSSGREMALSRRQDFRTVRSSSGSIEPLPENKTNS